MDKIPDLMHGFLSHMNFATVIRPHILQFIRKLYSAIYLLVDVSFQGTPQLKIKQNYSVTWDFFHSNLPVSQVLGI